MDVEITYFEQVLGDRENFIDWSGLRVKRLNGTKERGLVGQVIHHVALNNSYQVEECFYRREGGEYKLRPYKIQRKLFCDLFLSHIFFKRLSKVSDLPYPACPLPNVAYF